MCSSFVENNFSIKKKICKHIKKVSVCHNCKLWAFFPDFAIILSVYVSTYMSNINRIYIMPQEPYLYKILKVKP